MESLSEIGKTIIDKVTPNWISNQSDENGNTVVTPLINMRPASFADLEDRQLIKLLTFVNHSDLLQCRLVNRRFKEAISASKLFLSSTIFVVSIKPDNQTDSSFLDSPIPHENTRFEYIDYEVYLKQKKFDELASGNYYFRPSVKYLSNLTSMEFQNCFITWETIKRIVNNTPKLENFALMRCKFSEERTVAALGEFDEFRVGRTFSNLKSIKIMEYENLKPLNKILEKLVGYSARFLEQIFISFDPTEESVESKETIVDEKDLETFCNNARKLIELNVPVLKKLTMDLKYQPLLNQICPNVFGAMDNLWEDMKLEEFMLSPPGCTPTPNIVDITQNCVSSVQVLIGFLESQKHLKKAALPHFRNMGIGQEKHYRTKIGCSVPKSIQYLCVPNQEYLAKDFFLRFSHLKKLYVGGATTDTGLPVALKSEMFDLAKPVTFQPTAYTNLDVDLALSGSQLMSTKRSEALDQIRELGIGSSIINGIELMKIIKKFNYLVKFEVTSQLPVMQDEDLQCVIENMPWLQYLSISACDFLTDFGLTGILRNSCEMMVRLDNYHGVSDSIIDVQASSGKPLSQLKGMRNLILMGKSHISDVGIHFGLRFQELSTACLPYNENITEWGICQFGKHNPSLQVFVMWSLNQRSKEGFLELQNSHPRVRKNKCTYLNYSDDVKPNDFSNSLVKFDILKNAFSSSMSGMCPTFNFTWLFGQNSGNTPEEELAASDENDGDQVIMDMQEPGRTSPVTTEQF